MICDNFEQLPKSRKTMRMSLNQPICCMSNYCAKMMSFQMAKNSDQTVIQGVQ